MQRTWAKLVGGLGLLLTVVSVGATEKTAGPSRTVAIVRTAAWSHGDATREGAAELVVWMEIARLAHGGGQAGLVAVGDRRGLFSAGAEEALCQAVLRGLPVVKLADNGRVLPAPHGLFLDGRGLTADEARQVLERCLERYGALPTGRHELRRHLELCQNEFTLAAGTRVALR